MPAKNQDLHGSVPDNGSVTLLLIDVINDMDFEGSDALVRQAVPMAHRLAALKRRVKEAKIPCVYINDNFGRWQSDFRNWSTTASTTRSPGARWRACCGPTTTTTLS
jgi:nicotinamidase-related amidase